MNAFIEILNVWGGRLIGASASLLWQSSLLIVVVGALDLVLRRKVRAAIRYGLWLVVLVKLLLPPSLALPSGVAWWTRSSTQPAVPSHTREVIVTYGPVTGPQQSDPVPLVQPASRTPVSVSAGLLLIWAIVSLGLLGWMLVRWGRVSRGLKAATAAPDWLQHLLEETRRGAGLRRGPELRLTEGAISPAACGLFRPVIVLPRALTEKLAPAQLRAVLLHEFIHLRRNDVWMNCAQALLQIVYWWHPLLWLANARIRRLREEAVDDAVMLALREEGENYAPALLEVAKLALNRPLAALALVGILESKSALRRRIERLVDFTLPKRAGLSVVSWLGIGVFAALAVPMGTAPASSSVNGIGAATVDSPSEHSMSPASNQSPTNASLSVRIFKLDMGNFRRQMGLSATNTPGAWHRALLGWFAEAGVEMQPPKRFFLSEATGLLTVRVASSELDAIEKAVRRLNGFSSNSAAASPGNRAFAGTSATNSSKIATLVQDGKLLYEMGKLDEAEGKLKQALTLEPGNPPALYYLALVEEARRTPHRWSPVVFPVLRTRTFKVNAEAFLSNLRRQTGLRAGNSREEEERALIQLFAKAGAAWQGDYNLFFDDRNGTLVVRAMDPDMDFIEAVIQSLDQAPPPEINLKVKFVALPEDAVRRLIPGETTNAGQRAMDLSPAVQSAGGAGTTVFSLIGGQVYRSASPQQPRSAYFKSMTTISNLPVTLLGLLTEAQYHDVGGALKKVAGADLLFDGQVTTLSGRQAQLARVDMAPIVTNINPRALTPPGIFSVRGTNALYQTTLVPLGPTLVVVPCITADGHSVDLTLIPSMADFLGYKSVTQHFTVYVDGKRESVLMPAPRWTVQQIFARVVVGDGQTVVLGSLPDRRTKQAGHSAAGHKQILVFVTPTFVNASGNRVHGDGKIPLQNEKPRSHDPQELSSLHG